MVFSILLLAISISALRKTGLKKIAYASAAFALFAIQLFYEYLEENIFNMLDTPYTDIILSSMTLAILVLFFLVVVKKR